MEYMGTITEGSIRNVILLTNKAQSNVVEYAVPLCYVQKAHELYDLLQIDGQHTLCWPRDEIAWNVFHLVCADWLWHNDNRAIGIFYPERLSEYFPKTPREYNKSVMYFNPACEQRCCRMDVIFLLDGCHEFIGAANAMARAVILIETEEAKDEH